MKSILSLVFIILFLSSCKDETKDYTSISGQWRCQETGTSNTVYIIDLEKSSANTNVYAIYNFNQEGNEERVFATFQNDSLYMETQFIGSTSKSIEGTAVVTDDNKSMQIEYFLTDGMGTREISCNCTHL